MANDVMILEHLERIEDRIAPITETARSLAELRDELSPRVNEAVHALIREMADVEADFQIEDLLFLIKKVLRNVKNLSFGLDQIKNAIDFAVTVEPLLKSAVPQIIFHLDDLERSGAFRWLRLAMDTIGKIGASYSEEEMAQIGAGMVRLAGILKKLTRPEALAFLERIAGLPAEVDLTAAREASLGRMLRSLGDRDTRLGLGVMIELTRGLAKLQESR